MSFDTLETKLLTTAFNIVYQKNDIAKEMDDE